MAKAQKNVHAASHGAAKRDAEKASQVPSRKVSQKAALPKSNLPLTQRKLKTQGGTIFYWTTPAVTGAPWLIFLPGLSANHALFNAQLEHFTGRYNCLVWDAPSHGQSRPFRLDWTLEDLAGYLHTIVEENNIAKPVLIGHSYGGYVAQAYMARYPYTITGFVSIDSGPLERRFYKDWELWLLRHTYGMYNAIPWNMLVKWGSEKNSTTKSGQLQMRMLMESYQKMRYVDLLSHAYTVLEAAVQQSDCRGGKSIPTLFLCGEKDEAGFVRRYNAEWASAEGFPIHWIVGAGHNSMVDRPRDVNTFIDSFLENLKLGAHARHPSRRSRDYF